MARKINSKYKFGRFGMAFALIFFPIYGPIIAIALALIDAGNLLVKSIRYELPRVARFVFTGKE